MRRYVFLFSLLALVFLVAAPAGKAFAQENDQASQSTEISEKSLHAALDACSLGLLFHEDVVEAKTVMELAGWRAITTEDEAWYMSVETQSTAGWSAYQAGVSDTDEAKRILSDAHTNARSMFTGDVHEGIIFRGEADAMLRLLPEQRECVLLTGKSTAADAVYHSLPDIVSATVNSPLLDARSDPDAETNGGVLESNLINTAEMSRLFGTSYDISYVFLISAKPFSE